MVISSISLLNYRNFKKKELRFSPGLNFITGNNGIGKTNILESISVLANIRSFRSGGDSVLINNGEDAFFIRGEFETEDGDSLFEYGCRVDKGIKRKLKIDGEEIKKISDYYSRICTVLFSPDDNDLVEGPPEGRRKYLDSIISKIDSPYFRAVGMYKKVLHHRNQIIKKRSPHIHKEIAPWNELLAEHGLYIIQKRREILTRLSSNITLYYDKISSGDKTVSISYDPSVDALNKERIVEALEACINRDIRLKTTTIGPHRDSYTILYDDNDIKHYGSQGQKRTCAIALKIAERDLIEEYSGKKSIVLIDDIFSELDKMRRNNLIKLVCTENQVIFTLVSHELLDQSLIEKGSLFTLQ